MPTKPGFQATHRFKAGLSKTLDTLFDIFDMRLGFHNQQHTLLILIPTQV